MLTTGFSGCLFVTRRLGPNQVRRSVARLLGVAAVALMLLSPSPASAATYYWQTSSGDWSQAANWGGTLPTSSDLAYIDNGGTATVTQSGEVCGTLTLGDAAGSGTVQIAAGGSLTTAYQYIGYSGVGSVTQSGGSNNIYGGYNGSNTALYLGYNSGASGSYGLGGGLLSSWNDYVGYSGTGSITQSGGGNNVDYLYLGYNSGSAGTYNLSGRQLSGLQWRFGVHRLLRRRHFHAIGRKQLSFRRQSLPGLPLRRQRPVQLERRPVVGRQRIRRLRSSAHGAHAADRRREHHHLLSIGAGGQYQFSGGTLQASGGIANQGVFDAGNQPVSISAGGIVDLSSGTWKGLGDASLSMATTRC